MLLGIRDLEQDMHQVPRQIIDHIVYLDVLHSPTPMRKESAPGRAVEFPGREPLNLRDKSSKNMK